MSDNFLASFAARDGQVTDIWLMRCKERSAGRLLGKDFLLDKTKTLSKSETCQETSLTTQMLPHLGLCTELWFNLLYPSCCHEGTYQSCTKDGRWERWGIPESLKTCQAPAPTLALLYSDFLLCERIKALKRFFWIFWYLHLYTSPLIQGGTFFA